MTGMNWDLPPGLRWLHSSWRLGRLFGVELRVHVTTLLLPILSWLQLASVPGLPFGMIATIIAIDVGLLYVVVIVHEFGHIVAGRRFGIRTSLITLSPLGGLAHLQRRARSPGADIVIALAGPATHLVWLAVAWPLRSAVAGSGLFPVLFVERIWFLNLGLLLFNLLPFWPLDGGRVLRSALALRLHPNRASLYAGRIAIGGGIVLAALGLFTSSFSGFLLALIGWRCLFEGRALIQSARYDASPYDQAVEPWETDAEAWKRGAGEDGEDRASRRLARREAKAEARASKEAEQRSEERRAVERRLDELLARVSEVGITGLAPAERTELQRLSEAMQKERGAGRR